MTEIIIGCSYTYGSALEMDCEEEPTWRISFSNDTTQVDLWSCDHHLADLVRAAPDDFVADTLTLEELP